MGDSHLCLQDWFIQKKIPYPFTEKELDNQFQKMYAGDLNARKEIIEHNIRLVIYEAKKYSNNGYDPRELVCTGIIGLIKSVDSFDISRKIKFATYASRCIDNEIRMFLRRNKKYIDDAHLESTLSVDYEGHELKVEDIIFDENVNFISDYENQDDYRVIRQVVSELPEKDKLVIMMRFGFIDDKIMTQKEIADLLGISQSYVSRMTSKILKK